LIRVLLADDQSLINMPGTDGLEATKRIVADERLAELKVARCASSVHTTEPNSRDRLRGRARLQSRSVVGQ
jgi:CheY-like chemotaxis protein